MLNKKLQSKQKPDIYYIILDRHLSPKALQICYNYNCNSFLSSLKRKNFSIPLKSRSNYSVTVLSVPSSLNMNYHKIHTSRSDTFHGLATHMVDNNNVAFFLKKLGYKFINIPSLWGPARKSSFTNINYTYHVPSQFHYVFFGSTLLIYLWRILYEYNKHKCIKGQLNFLKQTTTISGPKFVFAHINCPHDLFVFGKNGEFKYLQWVTKAQPYLNQLDFIDKQIDKVIEKILKKSSTPPIIILQSDHGDPYGFTGWNKLKKNDNIELGFGILSAFHLPNFDKNKLWNTISPVNNFRLIFNHYFGTNFEYLEDKYIELKPQD
ncbi:MAG: sulfatase-like hydrolase/transferase [Candidatus Helarchaeota archaeon]